MPVRTPRRRNDIGQQGDPSVERIKTVGLIGAGIIGAGWATRCLAHGVKVVAWDPGPEWERKLTGQIEAAWPSVERMYDADSAQRHNIRLARSLEEAVEQADFIQESAPETLEAKKELLARIDAVASPGVVIASSSSGLLPSSLQSACRAPERFVVGHPYHPVYLMPLVEVVGGQLTAARSIEIAAAFYAAVSMHPLRVRREMPGHVSTRLTQALWREALHMIAEGSASTADIDDAIRYGPGLRWSFMGSCLVYHMAGGEQGMRRMLEQFGPTLKLPWTRLPAPELTDELVQRLIEGTHAQAQGRSVEELERYRDDALISVSEALREVRKRHGFDALDNP